MRRWSAANRDSVNAKKRVRDRRYRADPSHREKQLQADRKWRAKNKEQVSATDRTYYDANRERIIANVLAYQSANRDKMRLRVLAYRCRVRNAPGNGVTAADVDSIRLAQSDRCRWCGVALRGKGEVDHVVPIKLGGAHDPTNIVLACKSCNCRKNAKPPERFMRERGITA